MLPIADPSDDAADDTPDQSTAEAEQPPAPADQPGVKTPQQMLQEMQQRQLQMQQQRATADSTLQAGPVLPFRRDNQPRSRTSNSSRFTLKGRGFQPRREGPIKRNFWQPLRADCQRAPGAPGS